MDAFEELRGSDGTLPGLPAVKLGEEKCQTVVDYRDLEELIEEFYPVEDISLVAEFAWNNDTYESLYIEGSWDTDWKTEWSDYSRPSVDQWLNDDPENLPRWRNGEIRQPSASSFLDDLYDLGIITQDEFMVHVSW